MDKQESADTQNTSRSSKVVSEKRKGKEWFIAGSIIFWVLVTLLAHWPTNSSLFLHLAGAIFVGYSFGYGLGTGWEKEGFGKLHKRHVVFLICFFALIIIGVLATIIGFHLHNTNLQKKAQQSESQYNYCITHSKNIASCNTGL